MPFPEVELGLAIGSLRQSHAHTLKSSLYARWKHDNPREAAAVELYWDDPSAIPVVRTETGQSYVDEAQALHYLGG